MDKPLPDHLWTTEECAIYLNVSVDWLNSSRGKGTGPPFVHIGRLIRYDPDAVKDWVRSRLVGSTSEQPK